MGKFSGKGKDLYDKRNAFDHKPWLIRLYGLLSAFVLTIVFIVVLEILSRKLPEASQPYKPSLSSLAKRDEWIKIEYLPKRQTLSSLANAPCGYDNTTIAVPCFEYCERFDVEFNSTCPTFCTRADIQPHPAVNCTGTTVESAACGYNETFTAQCLSFCAQANMTTAGLCNQACTTVGITPHDAAKCPVATPPAAPCGFSTNLTSNCTNYCTSHCEGSNCVTGQLNQTQCAETCDQVGIWPYNPAACTPTPPAAPCGFTTNLTRNCTDYCLNGCEGVSCDVTALNVTSCSGTCYDAGIWPYIAAQCPSSSSSSSTSSSSSSSSSSSTTSSSSSSISSSSSSTTSSSSSSSISSSTSSSSSVAIPSASAPPAPCGFSTDLTPECSSFCSCGELTCRITRRQMASINNTECAQSCLNSGIWPTEPLVCSSTTSSSSSTTSSSPTASVCAPTAAPTPPCGYNTSSISTQCNSFCSCGNVDGCEITKVRRQSPDFLITCPESCYLNCIVPYDPLPCTSSSSSSSTVSSTSVSISSSSALYTNSSTSSSTLSSSSSSSISSTVSSSSVTPSTSSVTSTQSSSSSSVSTTSTTSTTSSTSSTSSISSGQPLSSSSISTSSTSSISSPPVLVVVPISSPTTSLSIPSVSASQSSSSVPVVLVGGPSTTPPLSSGPVSPPFTPPAVVVPLSSPASNPQNAASPPPVVGSVNPPPNSVPVPPVQNKGPLPTAGQVITSISLSVSTQPNGVLTTVPVEVVSTVASSSPSSAPSSGPVNSGGSGGTGGSGDSNPKTFKSSLFNLPSSFTFKGGYVPIILARIFAISWTGIHGQILNYQPFSQLARPGGAPGTVLLGADPKSVWFSWIAFGAATIITPIAPEIIYFDTNYKCDNPNPANPVNPCWPPIITINQWPLRLTQGLLGVVAIMTIASAYNSSQKPSGITADPTSIASVATYMGHPQITRDFLALGPDATKKDLKRFLKNKRYKLDTYMSPLGVERYGLVPVLKPGESADDQNMSPLENLRESDRKSNKSSKFGPYTVWKAISTYIDGIFLLFVIGILSICASYVKDVGNSRLAKLFQYSSVGRRLIFTAIGLVVTMNWGRLLEDTQTVSPYLELSHQEGRPRSTVLLRRHTTALTALIPSFRNGHNTTAMVALTAILAEFLVVALAGLPYRPGQVQEEFFFCGISALIILVIMVLVIAFVSFWRRYLPHLPRKPNSTAAVMTYLADSEMVGDFEGAEKMKGWQRDLWVEEQGKLYEYSLRSREDGQMRWTIDHASKHHHGEQDASMEVSWLMGTRVTSQFD